MPRRSVEAFTETNMDFKALTQFFVQIAQPLKQQNHSTIKIVEDDSWSLGFNNKMNNIILFGLLNSDKRFNCSLLNPMQVRVKAQLFSWRDVINYTSNCIAKDESLTYIVCGMSKKNNPIKRSGYSSPAKAQLSLGLPDSIPQSTASVDILTMGDHYSALHQDWLYRYRVQEIPEWNAGGFKIYIVQKTLDARNTAFIMRESNFSNKVDQLSWIKSNLDLFHIVKIGPGERFFHNGRAFHAVLTIIDYQVNCNGLLLSYGYSILTANMKIAFANNAPPRKEDRVTEELKPCTRAAFQQYVLGKAFIKKAYVENSVSKSRTSKRLQLKIQSHTCDAKQSKNKGRFKRLLSTGSKKK